MEQLNLEQRGKQLIDELAECTDSMYTIGPWLMMLTNAAMASVNDDDAAGLANVLTQFDECIESFQTLGNVLQKLHLFRDLLQHAGENDGGE